MRIEPGVRKPTSRRHRCEVGHDNLAVFVALLATLTSCRGSDRAPQPRLDKLDQQVSGELRAGQELFRLLVRTRPGGIARVTAQAEARRASVRSLSPASRVLAIDADRATLEHLIANPDVERISSDAPVQSSGVTWTSTSTTTPQENRLVRALGMDYWVPDGKGVVVAVIDSGVVANSDLQTRGQVRLHLTGRPRRPPAATYSSTPTVTARTSPASSPMSARRATRSTAGWLPARRFWRSRCWTPTAPAARATSSPRSTSASRTSTSSRSTSSTCRSAIRSTSRRPSDPLVQAVERAVRAGIAVDRLGRQSRAQTRHRRRWVRRHHLAWQRAVGDHRRGGGFPGHAGAAGRCGRAIQLARPDVVRRLREAGRRRGRPPSAGPHGKGKPPVHSFSSSLTVMPGAGHKFLTLSGTSMAAAVATGVAAQVLKTMRLATGISTLTFDGRLPASMASAIRHAVHEVRGGRLRTLQVGHHAVTAQGDPAIHRGPAAGCPRARARRWRT